MPKTEVTEFNATVKVDYRDDDEIEIENEIDLDKLEAEYDIYAAECTAAMKLTLDRIDYLRSAISSTGKRNPFDQIEHRIKTFKSTKEKCKTRGYELNIASIRENVKDVAGIRIVTKYMDEVEEVRNLIGQLPGVTPVITKDYVTTPKPNGYSSMHVSCLVEIYDPYKGSQLMPVEIQIRSKAMNLWATLEHDLKYKNSNPSPEVDEKFAKISKILRDFEREAIALRDHQEEKKPAKAKKKART